MLLLVGVAIATLVLVTARVLTAELSADARRELTHEASKFASFAAQGDPATGRPFEDASTMLSSYLARSLPNANEAFFSIVDGRPAYRSAPTPRARLDRDAAFVDAAARATEPIWGRRSTEAGDIYYAVQPVRVHGSSTRGALVVVEFQRDAQTRVASMIRVLALVGIGSWMLAGAIGWLIAGRVLAPIRAVRTTAEAIGESDLSRRIEVNGDGEVASLAETFNRMLDRVELAFATQREFLDDAGHELRTPITVVRGHLETADTDPAHFARTRSLVIAELDRMARIVDDLMVLAKSERPDFLIESPVDLTDVVVETLATVQLIAPRNWSVAEVADATARADPQRLTQALTQLVSNAVEHTDVHDTIALGSRVVGDRMLLWVSDTGEGIAVDEQPTIFERFSRGRASNHGKGAGLGLAIVASIARAHGGTVRVDSAIGEGSTFTLDLPFVDASVGEPEEVR